MSSISPKSVAQREAERDVSALALMGDLGEAILHVVPIGERKPYVLAIRRVRELGLAIAAGQCLRISDDL